MEDVLDVYQRPYNEHHPVVCIDETNKQLIHQSRIPCEPGKPEKVDYEYVRNGVANVFMISEPLAGKREVLVSEQRTAIDFANALKHVADKLYPNAHKIVLVMDNLNTHKPDSLYKAFVPAEAKRLLDRFEWHFTPKHGSWLNMAEIEIGVMCHQELAKPLPDMESFKNQIEDWVQQRNSHVAKINWQFTNDDGRIKLKTLYPVVL